MEGRRRGKENAGKIKYQGGQKILQMWGEDEGNSLYFVELLSRPSKALCCDIADARFNVRNSRIEEFQSTSALERLCIEARWVGIPKQTFVIGWSISDAFVGRIVAFRFACIL